ncbi:MAG: HEPN domain-containing protein [Anaerolineae bacterium]
MPVPDSLIPSEWFAKAEEDIRAAELLLAHDGPSGIAAFLVQQAVEKHLKGYLLSTGWSFERIHDLEALLGEASARDEEFAPFLAACQRITEYYIEGRYPIGLSSALTRDEVTASLEDARRLATLVREKVAKASATGTNSL